MSTFLERRERAIVALSGTTLDLLVIGGGITGAGIARDGAMRGLQTGLVEQSDFASGTSSRSSRLLHGGLRYLAQGQIGLVHDASVEKKIIRQIAPHLAEPLPFVFPAYRKHNPPLWKLKLGVKIYDLLCAGKNFGSSSWLNPNETLQRAPDLDGDGLIGAVRYFDAFTNDSRLVLDTLRSAAVHGAVLLNYCHFVTATRGQFWECKLADSLSGRNFVVKARTVANATGPWAGSLPHSRVKLRLTKGVHLVVERRRISALDAVVMTEGTRILFAIPWGERTILGTTDTDYNGPLDRIFADESDIRYVLDVTNRFFPRARLTNADVMSSWAGMRPLISRQAGAPSDISRSHEIRNPEPGWWDVAGGKLTTYRLMAEQTVDEIAKALKQEGMARKIAACRTAKAPLLSPMEVKEVSGLLPPPFTREVVTHFCENEWASHLDDVMVRRSNWHYYCSDADTRAEQACAWMAEFLGWPQAAQAGEIRHYRTATGRRESASDGK